MLGSFQSMLDSSEIITTYKYTYKFGNKLYLVFALKYFLTKIRVTVLVSTYYVGIYSCENSIIFGQF